MTGSGLKTLSLTTSSRIMPWPSPLKCRAGVEVMIANGHKLLVEKGAGSGSGFEDAAYAAAGAELVATPQEIYERADMVMHVKEPLPSEYDMIREGQIVFTYLPFFHVAFGSAPIDAASWARVVAVALGVLLVVGVEKGMRRFWLAVGAAWSGLAAFAD